MSMATEYMDYGYFTGMDVPAPVPVDTEKKTQVYLATHDGYNKTLYGTRTPYRYRSFISFKFGGRNIEDFNLIATIDGDRMTRNVSAQFEDLTSSSDVVNGQLYHGTHYKSNTLSFVLATDAIDLLMLEDFKNWFRGGEARPLILAEHPNREIMARVSLPPEISMLPFEKEVTLNIAGNEYKTSVTEYRGTIHLELVMDEPFWYSRVNIFGDVRDGVYIDTWEGVQLFSGNSSDEDVLKDVLKMIYEDGIPISSMVSVPMLFGDNLYAAAGNTAISSIAEPYENVLAWATDSGATVLYDLETGEPTSITGQSTGYYLNGDTFLFPEAEDKGEKLFPAPDDPDNPVEPGVIPTYKYYRGAVIQATGTSTIESTGSIFGPYIKSAEGEGLHFPPYEENAFNIYYAGTAPAPVEILFTIPIFLYSNLEEPSKHGCVASIYSDMYKNGDKTYCSMFLREEKDLEMRITTPSLLSSYNKGIELFSNTDLIHIGAAWQDIREAVLDLIRHPRIREHMLAIITLEEAKTYDTTNNNYDVNSEGKVTTNDLSDIKSYLLNYLANSRYDAITSWLTVRINSRTGEVIGTYKIGNIEFEENVGDMLSSNHLILENRNYFNKDTYTIMAWSSEHKNYSYKLYHDFPCTLSGFRITYKYLYY